MAPWVYDPHSGGVNIPDRVKERTRTRILDHATRHHRDAHLVRACKENLRLTVANSEKGGINTGEIYLHMTTSDEILPAACHDLNDLTHQYTPLRSPNKTK